MEKSQTIDDKPIGDPIAKFRRLASATGNVRPPLSMRERYVLWASAPLIFLSPWHAGSMLWWSNLANLGLALLPVIAAFMPLKARHSDPVLSATSGQVLKKLLRFPLFWIGLLFLGYIAIQCLNYSWEFMWTANKRGFYMQEIPPDQYISWLPSGMKMPFKMNNGWQAFLMWMVPWLAVCAMWCGFRRRKCWRVVLWMISAVGALLAVLGIAAQITAPDKIFWIWDRGSAGPFGPFTYRNQGSTLLYMAIASSAALFFYYQRGVESRSGIQLLPLLLGLVSLGGSVMSFSRAGWIGTAIVLLGVIVLFVLQLLWQRDYSWKLALFQGCIILAVIASMGYLIAQANLKPILNKWTPIARSWDEGKVVDYSLYFRQLAAKKTLVMFEDNPITGWGANSFKFYFPVYQQGDDMLTNARNIRGKLMPNKRLFWKNAHSDWAQLLAEYGIAGCTLLLSGLFYWWGSLIRWLGSMRCEQWILIFATATAVAQAVLDIVFYNPCLLIFFMLLLGCARGTLDVPLAGTKRRSDYSLRGG